MVDDLKEHSIAKRPYARSIALPTEAARLTHAASLQ
jgi:hypothetical protein